MKKRSILTLFVILFLKGALLFSQNTPALVTTELVSSGVYSGNSISVYKLDSDKVPYQVRVMDKSGNARQFYVIRRVSDLYAYLMIEKKGKELLYYPLTWSDKNAIRVSDINERSIDILNGDIAQVSQNGL